MTSPAITAQSGATRGPEILVAERPDVLVTIGDPWMFSAVVNMAERREVKWVAYFPALGGRDVLDHGEAPS